LNLVVAAEGVARARQTERHWLIGRRYVRHDGGVRIAVLEGDPARRLANEHVLRRIHRVVAHQQAGLAPSSSARETFDRGGQLTVARERSERVELGRASCRE